MAVSYPDTPGVSRYFDAYRTSLKRTIFTKTCNTHTTINIHNNHI